MKIHGHELQLADMMSDGVVVLLSGGLDSYTAAAILEADGYRLHALSVRYGQRHVRELEAARRVGVGTWRRARISSCRWISRASAGRR